MTFRGCLIVCYNMLQCMFFNLINSLCFRNEASIKMLPAYVLPGPDSTSFPYTGVPVVLHTPKASVGRPI